MATGADGARTFKGSWHQHGGQPISAESSHLFSSYAMGQVSPFLSSARLMSDAPDLVAFARGEAAAVPSHPATTGVANASFEVPDWLPATTEDTMSLQGMLPSHIPASSQAGAHSAVLAWMAAGVQFTRFRRCNEGVEPAVASSSSSSSSSSSTSSEQPAVVHEHGVLRYVAGPTADRAEDVAGALVWSSESGDSMFPPAELRLPTETICEWYLSVSFHLLALTRPPFRGAVSDFLASYSSGVLCPSCVCVLVVHKCLKCVTLLRYLPLLGALLLLLLPMMLRSSSCRSAAAARRAVGVG